MELSWAGQCACAVSLCGPSWSLSGLQGPVLAVNPRIGLSGKDITPHFKFLGCTVQT